MNYRKPLIFGLTALAVFAVAVPVVKYSGESNAQRELRLRRDEALKAGLKLQPADFSPSADQAARAQVIRKLMEREPFSFPHIFSPWLVGARAMPGSDWGVAFDWNDLAGRLQPLSSDLDEVRRAVQGGESFRFEQIAQKFAPGIRPGAMPQVDAPRIGPVADAFVTRATLAFREGRPDDAWADLLAVHALAARFDPGICAGPHMERADLTRTAFAAAWDAMRRHPWSDARLAELEQPWLGANLFRGLVDIPMYQCAEAVDRDERTMMSMAQSHALIPAMFQLGRQAVSKPRAAWKEFRVSQQWPKHQLNFVRELGPQGELRALRRYTARINDLRHVLAMPDWRTMQTYPGIDSIATLRFAEDGAPEQCRPYADGSTEYSLASIMDAEARRRILLAAIAVERAKLRLGRLPATLAEAGPTLPDLMDGQPLRYRPEPDGTYRIYSIGLDLVDDGGETLPSTPADLPKDDIVWPRYVRGNGLLKSNVSP